MNTGKKEPPMATKLNHEQKGILDDQLFALRDKTVNGVRDFNEVRKALQEIIEGRFYTPIPEKLLMQVRSPLWYTLPEQQLEHVRQLNKQRDWGFEDSDFPSIPEDIQLHGDEVLLLCVSLRAQRGKSALQRTFEELWYLSEAPTDYTKWRWDELKSDSKHLRQAPGYKHTPGIRWVVFNPNAYHGKSPEAALKQSKIDNVQLAGLEVLMAVLLFPTWATSWNGDTSAYPNMSGLQFYWNTDWSRVPYLDRWGDGRQLGLYAGWAGYSGVCFASPSVREC